MGFADTGELWRSGYDMTPAEIAAETDRLWGQVKPLYDQLHCYTRTQAGGEVRRRQGAVAGGMMPAHLMGNMWQQDWGNLWDILQPYQNGGGSLDITGALEAAARRRTSTARWRKHDGSPTAERAASRSSATPSSPPPRR